MSLTDEDKEWLTKTSATKQDLERALQTFATKQDLEHALQTFATKQDLERVETTLLTEFHKWASPMEARQRTHAAAIKAVDAEMQYPLGSRH